MTEPHLASPQQSPAITLGRVSRLFGSFVALRELTVSIPAGASVMLLGENGAGKSTLLKLVAGLQSASYGTVQVFGAAPRLNRTRIAYMSHATMLYDELTGPENLRYFAALCELANPAQAAADALVAVGLDPANPRRVGEYSQGMRQRAALARTLLGEPDLLLLDEPFSNLDVGSAARMIERLLAYLRAPGTDGQPRTLLFTTHQAELAQPLAHTTVTLAGGRLASVSGEALA
jgi:ABC-type multidrug transport system ATPase subunit